MSRQYLWSKITKVKTENAPIVYHLFFRNTYYTLECYKEESDCQKPLNYSIAENFTDDEGLAEDFLNQMVRRRVFPVHIIDMVQDLLR